ncbi:MAG: hypothetical protein ACE5I0_02160, partial [Candidatus Binatia bacterium]
MEVNLRQERQRWVTCWFTDILLSYMEETFKEKKGVNFPALFSGVEGFETPANPESFLRDVNNWVPLTVLRELQWQCERISERKDVSYHAGKAYFDPGKKQLPSLFEIIARVLSDVRSVLISTNLWGVVQTNYLRLQSFEKKSTRPEMYMLAQFDESARPAVGTVHLLRGICEGFPRLYPFIEDVQCIEEISQLRIEDVTQEFPDFKVKSEGDRLSIRHRTSQQSIVDALKVPLKAEVVPLSQEFMVNIPDATVIPPRDDRIEVLTALEDTGSEKKAQAQQAYKIVSPGELSDGTLSYSFKKDQIYNAPYSRFRFVVKESSKQDKEISAENVRKEVSQLLFDHLKQIKQTQMRVIQYNIERRRLT